jgi:radical SAM superfamily enzyme YgiQ (UPF0313 family)
LKNNKSSTILIVYPSSLYAAGWGIHQELKTSHLLLASYLAQYFPVIFADLEISIGSPNSPSQVKRFERRVRQYLSEQDFDILAISCWASLSYTATLRVARTCRELYSDRLIVVGGYHPTACPDDFVLPDFPVDYIIRGEGENSLKEITEHYARSGRPENPQIVQSSVFGEEQFVGCNWDLINDYAANYFPEGLPNIFLYLSRGCPFGCSFCMEPLKDRSWRSFSPEEAVEEMVTGAERFNSLGVALCDACFGKKASWRKEFLKILVEAKPKFWTIFETRPEYLDEEDVGYLAQINTEIQFGVESGSPEILTLMHKTRQPDKFLDKFANISNMLSDHQILHRANLIFNHPGETKKTLSETFAFIDRMLDRDNSYLMWASAGYMHFPGCELYDKMDFYKREYGSKFNGGEWWKKEEDQYANSTDNEPSSDLSGSQANLWQTMLAERSEQLKATLAPAAFKYAASKYFLDWKNDPRFTQK